MAKVSVSVQYRVPIDSMQTSIRQL